MSSRGNLTDEECGITPPFWGLFPVQRCGPCQSGQMWKLSWTADREQCSVSLQSVWSTTIIITTLMTAASKRIFFTLKMIKTFIQNSRRQGWEPWLSTAKSLDDSHIIKEKMTSIVVISSHPALVELFLHPWAANYSFLFLCLALSLSASCLQRCLCHSLGLILLTEENFSIMCADRVNDHQSSQWSFCINEEKSRSLKSD